MREHVAEGSQQELTHTKIGGKLVTQNFYVLEQ